MVKKPIVLVNRRAIEVLRWQWQIKGMASFEVRAADETINPDDRRYVFEAPDDVHAVDSGWQALQIDIGKDVHFKRTIWAGKRIECKDFLVGIVGALVANRIGRCVVCDRPPNTKTVKEIHDGWCHGGCSKRAEGGVRWIKDLEAPDRILPVNPRVLPGLPAASS
ncbi:MAG: hypothetical protein ACR2RE_28150 [Geminicoccaceae bacterium]